MAFEAPKYETIFVSAQGQTTVRLIARTTNILCDTARSLQARYFVTIDGWDHMNDCPIWGVFDMRTADPNGGGPRTWAVRAPVKTFATESSDPAVMWAVMMLGRK